MGLKEDMAYVETEQLITLRARMDKVVDTLKKARAETAAKLTPEGLAEIDHATQKQEAKAQLFADELRRRMN